MSAFHLSEKTAAQLLSRKSLSLRHGATGFIQGVILFGIALLAVVIAAFSLSNRSSSTSTVAEEQKTYAGTIISAGNQLKAAIDRFATDRGDTTTMTFNSAAGTGLFNTTDNFISPPQLSPRAFDGGVFTPPATSASRNGFFNYRRFGATTTNNVTVDTITSASIVTTGPLNLGTCQRINNAIFRNTNIPGPLTTGTAAAFAGGTTAISIPANTFGTGIPFEEGCVLPQGATASTVPTTGTYYYFKLVARS